MAASLRRCGRRTAVLALSVCVACTGGTGGCHPDDHNKGICSAPLQSSASDFASVPHRQIQPQAPFRPLSPVVQPDVGALQYELFLPSTFRPNSSGDATQHPVLVFLHGRGESGDFEITNEQSLPWQLLQNSSFASSFPYIVIVPQCPWECAEQNGWLPNVLRQVTATVAKVVNQFNGDPTRVYLAGQSMGGHGAWTYTAQQRGLFAAVVVICGYTRAGAETDAVADRLRGLPVAVVHAVDDVVIPVGASDAMVAKMQALGQRPLYIRYETAPPPPIEGTEHMTGHGSYELAFRDRALYALLGVQRCASCSPATSRWEALELLGNGDIDYD